MAENFTIQPFSIKVLEEIFGPNEAGRIALLQFGKGSTEQSVTFPVEQPSTAYASAVTTLSNQGDESVYATTPSTTWRPMTATPRLSPASATRRPMSTASSATSSRPPRRFPFQ